MSTSRALVAMTLRRSGFSRPWAQFFWKLQALHRARLDKAKSRMATLDKAEADLKVRVAEAQTWFRQASEELKAAQGELAKRDVELTMKLADVERRRGTWPRPPRPPGPNTRLH